MMINTIVQIYYCIIICLLIIRNVNCNGNDIHALEPLEYNSLKKFYDTTNGTNWNSKCNNWVFDNDYTAPCISGWYGVTCSCTIQYSYYYNGYSYYYDCTVIRLILENCELDGYIPTEIGYLSNLEWFSLYSNRLSSSIPSEIGKLTMIYRLGLHHNSFTSSIPSEIGNLIYLDNLDLSSNSLTSTIPSEIGLLSNLNNLILSSNSLTGLIHHHHYYY